MEIVGGVWDSNGCLLQHLVLSVGRIGPNGTDSAVHLVQQRKEDEIDHIT